MNQDIVLTVDYHDENCVIRRRAVTTGEEQVLTVPTAAKEILDVVNQAKHLAGRRGRVVWIQESTTGWARTRSDARAIIASGCALV